MRNETGSRVQDDGYCRIRGILEPGCRLAYTLNYQRLPATNCQWQAPQRRDNVSQYIVLLQPPLPQDAPMRTSLTSYGASSRVTASNNPRMTTNPVNHRLCTTRKNFPACYRNHVRSFKHRRPSPALVRFFRVRNARMALSSRGVRWLVTSPACVCASNFDSLFTY